MASGRRGGMKLFFIGDIVGSPGRAAVKALVPEIVAEHGVDLVLANGENAAGGNGITKQLVEEILGDGVHGITLGDHTWDQRGFELEVGSTEGVCIPANFPSMCPGKRSLILEAAGKRIGVFCLLGETFMRHKVACPFATADRMIEELGAKVDYIFVDIHAEATAEKIALSWHLDGRVAGLVGSHTHVATADACVRPQGMAYISDMGMTGPMKSVIGRDIEAVVQRFRSSMPVRFSMASEDVWLSGVLIEIDEQSGKAVSAELVKKPLSA